MWIAGLSRREFWYWFGQGMFWWGLLASVILAILILWKHQIPDQRPEPALRPDLCEQYCLELRPERAVLRRTHTITVDLEDIDGSASAECRCVYYR